MKLALCSSLAFVLLAQVFALSSHGVEKSAGDDPQEIGEQDYVRELREWSTFFSPVFAWLRVEHQEKTRGKNGAAEQTTANSPQRKQASSEISYGVTDKVKNFSQTISESLVFGKMCSCLQWGRIAIKTSI